MELLKEVFQSQTVTTLKKNLSDVLYAYLKDWLNLAPESEFNEFEPRLKSAKNRF